MAKRFRVYPLNTEEPYMSNYDDYIRSFQWRMRSIWLKKKTDFTCEGCGHGIATDLHVHHKHYKTLGKETSADVEVLCKQCHKKRHPGW